MVGEVNTARTLDAIATADVIYTDAWPRTDDSARSEIESAFAPLQITADVLESAPTLCVFLPCPPVTRGQEVDDGAMAHAKCAVPAAKEWLLHAQNALLIEMFGTKRTS